MNCLESNIDLQCVIVAGGKGTRLRPLTNSIPKPMVTVLGVPFLEILISRLVAQGLWKFLILTGYQATIIQNYFGDGSKLNCSISYSNEATPLGSGGALWNAQKRLDDEFLYINGDDYLEIKYGNLIRMFRDRRVDAMVVTYKNNQGQLDIDHSTNLVRRFDESLLLPYLDCGTKIFRKSVLKQITPKYPFTLEPTLWPALIKNQGLTSYIVKSESYGIDSVKKLKKLENILKKK